MALAPAGSMPVFCLVLASAFWAAGTIIAKEVLSVIPPIAFLILQLAPSVTLLWCMVAFTPKPVVTRRQVLAIALLGWLNPGLSYTLSMLGLAETSASTATLLWAAEPALIVALARLLLREQVRPATIALIALAAGGVLLVGNVTAIGESPSSVKGNALIFGGVLCCAVYTVLSRSVVAETSPLFIVAIQQSVGLAWVAAIWPLEQSATADLMSLPMRDVGAAVLSGVMYYVVAFWFYLHGLQSVRASTAGMFLNLIPVFGIAGAVVFLRESLSMPQWLGAAVILSAVAALLRAHSVQTAPANR